MVIGHWLLVTGGAFGADASRKSQVTSILEDGVAKQRLPKPFTIHPSSFTKKSVSKKRLPNLFPIPYSLFPKKPSTGGF